MSFLRFLFDEDWQQRRDIEELREQTMMLALRSTGPSDKWVKEIAEEVRELAVTVQVLMRTLAEANLLDIAKIQKQVTEELAPKPRPPKGARKRAAPPQPQGPPTEVTCVRCKAKGWSNEMVKVGADIWCRTCAKNP